MVWTSVVETQLNINNECYEPLLTQCWAQTQATRIVFWSHNAKPTYKEHYTVHSFDLRCPSLVLATGLGSLASDTEQGLAPPVFSRRSFSLLAAFSHLCPRFMGNKAVQWNAGSAAHVGFVCAVEAIRLRRGRRTITSCKWVWTGTDRVGKRAAQRRGENGSVLMKSILGSTLGNGPSDWTLSIQLCSGFPPWSYRTDS